MSFDIPENKSVIPFFLTDLVKKNFFKIKSRTETFGSKFLSLTQTKEERK